MTETITQLQAADIVGVTPRRMRQLDGEDNPPQRNGDGLYPCDAFGQWLRARIEADFVTSSDGTIYDLEAERARLAHHQANLAALEERTKRAELIPADVVTAEWCNQAANIRAKLLNLPGRGAPGDKDQRWTWALPDRRCSKNAEGAQQKTWASSGVDERLVEGDQDAQDMNVFCNDEHLRADFSEGAQDAHAQAFGNDEHRGRGWTIYRPGDRKGAAETGIRMLARIVEARRRTRQARQQCLICWTPTRIHSLDQFRHAFVDDPLGASVGHVAAEAGLLGGYVGGFLALRFRTIVRNRIVYPRSSVRIESAAVTHLILNRPCDGDLLGWRPSPFGSFGSRQSARFPTSESATGPLAFAQK
ncbi:hypothetical protein [Methylococcus capsulatus]|uniref:hypothetical protein n=1 Tax=Methylococcus capsulatus TaxID=414 RepID=UPI001C532954|nr:hypothetical protein [Methylococcus capsulatus]QXP94361.1 hypothetical protein KW113_03950 [Methylococcus capsulatus]